jgi:hypothetical protein
MLQIRLPYAPLQANRSSQLYLRVFTDDLYKKFKWNINMEKPIMIMIDIGSQHRCRTKFDSGKYFRICAELYEVARPNYLVA